MTLNPLSSPKQHLVLSPTEEFVLLIAGLFRAGATPEVYRTRPAAQRGIYHSQKREKGERPWLPDSDKVPTLHPSTIPDPGKSARARPGLYPTLATELERTPLSAVPALGMPPQAAFLVQLKGLSQNCCRIMPAGHHHPQPPSYSAVLGKAIRGLGPAGINIHRPRSRTAVSYLEAIR